MSSIVDLEKLFHRSKDRIRDLGEVFTPDSYVEEMLSLLAKDKRGIWSDEDISFFEPCSGHGNIVLPIYKRRLEGIYKKAVSHGLKSTEAAWYAVANALNTLWAIDIDAKNVENCRSRVLLATLVFLKHRLDVKNDYILLTKKREFFAHVLSAIKWHIDENETLSALSHPDTANASADLTRSGAKWFSHNGHNPMNFDLTWVSFFRSCESSKTVPLEFERSLRFIDGILAGKIRGLEDFEFAKAVIAIEKTQEVVRKPNRPLSAGA
jgi:hypothetical protein